MKTKIQKQKIADQREEYIRIDPICAAESKRLSALESRLCVLEAKCDVGKYSREETNEGKIDELKAFVERGFVAHKQQVDELEKQIERLSMFSGKEVIDRAQLDAVINFCESRIRDLNLRDSMRPATSQSEIFQKNRREDERRLLIDILHLASGK